MGLLDEAIREHLELKRRSGADPSEVAREEREALTPALPAEPPEGEAHMEEGLADEHGREHVTEAHALTLEDRSPDAPAEGSTVGQETAELDMEMVMDEDPDAGALSAPPAPFAASSTGADTGMDAPAGDVGDWGPSSEADEAQSWRQHDRERLSFEQ